MAQVVKTFQLTVNPDAPPALAIITPSPLPAAHIGVPYNQTLQAQGGVPPYTWSSGALPGGLTLNPTTGQLSGTPTLSGFFTFDVQVTDSGV